MYKYSPTQDGLPDYGEINPNYYDTLGMSSLIAKYDVPAQHKRLAANYITIKKIYGYTVIAAQLTNEEARTLSRYNFPRLECASIGQVNTELEQIKKWANSNDSVLRKHAEELFEIRVKELKFLYASGQPTRLYSEINNGYCALEKYLEFLAA